MVSADLFARLVARLHQHRVLALRGERAQEREHPEVRVRRTGPRQPVYDASERQRHVGGVVGAGGGPGDAARQLDGDELDERGERDGGVTRGAVVGVIAIRDHVGEFTEAALQRGLAADGHRPSPEVLQQLADGGRHGGDVFPQVARAGRRREAGDGAHDGGAERRRVHRQALRDGAQQPAERHDGAELRPLPHHRRRPRADPLAQVRVPVAARRAVLPHQRQRRLQHPRRAVALQQPLERRRSDELAERRRLAARPGGVDAAARVAVPGGRRRSDEQQAGARLEDGDGRRRRVLRLRALGDDATHHLVLHHLRVGRRQDADQQRVHRGAESNGTRRAANVASHRHRETPGSRGGKIHRCIDISRYFSRDTYRDIIFYNHNFFFFLVIFFFYYCFPQ